ncbi:pseudaminic acid cytidylyltransferase [Bermanella marisrubri]|uniref:pseudaminic acid cytidylyltransferase n=1 Tax=Bermanella marisrubri TaxID=207949 RepID=UPI001B3026F4|nr:pseudaminic acid cytidylyltransferase [Bermanella marisrubri]
MNVAIIPARGGSKRIADKNIRNFLGQPIIAYSINSALESKLFDRIIVSTDSAKISEIASYYGAEVPFIRPDELADDYTATVDVISHAVKELNLDDDDLVTCIYATAPFLNHQRLISAHELFHDQYPTYCFPVVEFEFPIQRSVSLHEGRVKVKEPSKIASRSQDLIPYYHDVGQFYVGLASTWKDRVPIISNEASAFVISRKLLIQRKTGLWPKTFIVLFIARAV